jgi:hypothetical protein
MKTVITKKIDGHEIITGFYRPIIDPVSTGQARDEAMKTVEDAIQVVKNLEALTDRKKQIIKSMRQGKDIAAKMKEIADLDNRIGENSRKLDEISRRLFNENPIYFAPKSGEKIITDEEHEEIKKKLDALKENEKLTADFKKIQDNRGVSYWIKKSGMWKSAEIDKIGKSLPRGARPQLSDVERQEVNEQLQKESIAKMEPSERDKHKQAELDNALALAALEKSKMEIQGDEKALEKSRQIFDSKRLEIEAKYQ